MSKTVHVGSASQFNSLVQSSTIVVTDCMHTPLILRPKLIISDAHKDFDPRVLIL